MTTSALIVRPLSVEVLAFLGGVIDARGHVEVSMRHDRPQPRLAVTTRRRPLLDHLCTLTGTKLTDDAREYARRPCGEHCRETHSHVARQSAKWRVDSARATVVLWAVRPFIVGQVDEVGRALSAGLAAWPAARGNTGAQMAALGWPLPPAGVALST